MVDGALRCPWLNRGVSCRHSPIAALNGRSPNLAVTSYYYHQNQQHRHKWTKQNTIVYKLLSQHPQVLRHRKLKKTQLVEATNGWLLPWTHPTFRYQTQCKDGHPHTNRGRLETSCKIGTFYTLMLRTPMDGSSLNKQWFKFKLTLNSIHSPAKRRELHNNDNRPWSEQWLTTEYTWRSRSWRWHSAADPHTKEQYSRIGSTNA